mmetsp:Transcript_16774/g.29263  ORF Transcript_16774/g.29263 Transcript_16774/m.29263 type:complete len:110 (+) Transcript_16774:1317-1646(+)
MPGFISLPATYYWDPLQRKPGIGKVGTPRYRWKGHGKGPTMHRYGVVSVQNQDGCLLGTAYHSTSQVRCCAGGMGVGDACARHREWALRLVSGLSPDDDADDDDADGHI